MNGKKAKMLRRLVKADEHRRAYRYLKKEFKRLNRLQKMGKQPLDK